MDVTFYTTKDSKNTINKTLENPVVFNDIKVKDEYNESNPSFYIHSKDNLLNKFNYAYIDIYDKKYFVNNVRLYARNTYIFELKEDVLETFKKDILKSKCMIVKQKDFNPYYNVNYDTEVRKKCSIIYSDKELELEDSNILVTIGG